MAAAVSSDRKINHVAKSAIYANALSWENSIRVNLRVANNVKSFGKNKYAFNSQNNLCRAEVK